MEPASSSPGPRVYSLSLGQTLATNEWVEWHIHRFLQSSFVARMLHMDRDDVVGRAVILWSTSYLEDPAGTLPDDDVLLAHKAQFRSVEQWQAMRDLALWGWEPVLIHDEETGQMLSGRLAHRTIERISAASAKRRDGKKAGREAHQLAVTRDRVKKKLADMGKKRFAENPKLLDEIAIWLGQSKLYVTEGNVAAALESLHGIPRVVPFPDAETK